MPPQKPMTAGRNAHAPQPGTFLQGRNQKAPDGSGHHYTGRETGQAPLDILVELVLQHIDAGRAQTGTGKGNEDPPATQQD